MHKPLTSIFAFLLGSGCMLAVVILLGAAKPAEQANQVDTQIVPIMGGLGMLLSVTDHAEQKTFLYELPREKDEPVKLMGSIDLSKVGEATLPAKITIPD